MASQVLSGQQGWRRMFKDNHPSWDPIWPSRPSTWSSPPSGPAQLAGGVESPLRNDPPMRGLPAPSDRNADRRISSVACWIWDYGLHVDRVQGEA